MQQAKKSNTNTKKSNTNTKKSNTKKSNTKKSNTKKSNTNTKKSNTIELKSNTNESITDTKKSNTNESNANTNESNTDTSNSISMANIIGNYQAVSNRRRLETLVRRETLISLQPAKFLILKISHKFGTDEKCQDYILDQLKLADMYQNICINETPASAFKLNMNWSKIPMPVEFYTPSKNLEGKQKNFSFEYFFEGKNIKSTCQSIEHCIATEPVWSEIILGKLKGCYILLQCLDIPGDGQILYSSINGVPCTKPAVIRPTYEFYIIVPHNVTI